MMSLNACPRVTSPIPSTAPRCTPAQLPRPGPFSCEDSFTSYLPSEAVDAMASPRKKEQASRAVSEQVEHLQRYRLAARLGCQGVISGRPVSARAGPSRLTTSSTGKRVMHLRDAPQRQRDDGEPPPDHPGDAPVPVPQRLPCRLAAPLRVPG